MITRRKRRNVMRSLCNTYYNTYQEKINLFSVCEDTKYNFDEVVKICVNLEAYHYLDCIFQKQNIEKFLIDGHQVLKYKKPEPPAFVSLTDDGKKYFEVKADRVFNFIMESILTPIAVSAITAFSVSWLPIFLPKFLSKFLPIIKEWFLSHFCF